MDEAPILIGHSFGGTIVEKLLGQGRGRAGIAIDAAGIKGVLPVPISALSDTGDVRHIALLIRIIGDRPNKPGQTDDDRLKALVKWPDFEADALTRLTTRLGQPAFRPLLQAMAHAPRLPYDDDLYEKFIRMQANETSSALFDRLTRRSRPRPILIFPFQPKFLRKKSGSRACTLS